MYIQYVLKLVSFSNVVVNGLSLPTEHTHNIPHDTTKAYT